MKEILASWIMFQLLFIGIFYGVIVSRIEHQTYNCEYSYSGETYRPMRYIFITTFIPLALFVAESPVGDYCALDNE